ncbi:MAG: dephospho-CoA kinase [Verrucomicrobia bacterium]|nr:MAG: dephospho-CoA kinase [Verrucomicrobiota bacterium]
MGTAIFGLTGGIGMGKSTAADIVRSLGIPVVDTDQIAREIVADGSEALAEIVARFGPGILHDDGSLDRPALATRVFRDPEQRLVLESILHPRIRTRWRGQSEAWRSAGVALGCVVIPLLFEKGYERDFDAVVAVGCSRGTQRVRIAGRGWDVAELGRREAAQWTPERKLAAANYLLWTEGTLEVHRRQWLRIIPSLGNG